MSASFAIAAASRRPLRLLLCAAVAAVLYLPGLGRPALWEPDEGRYAEIAREMVLTRDYVTPRDDWVRYFEKPPLVYWAEALSIKLAGVNELAVRLPAALATVAEVVVTAALGEAMFGASVGLAAAMVLGLSPLVFGFARFATLDPALALFITAALASFRMWACTPGGEDAAGSAGAAGARWFLLASALTAAGTLTKGPVALALTGAIGLAWLAGERRTGAIIRMPWLSAIAVYLAIAAPWFALAAWRNPGFLHFFFIHEHIERYLRNVEHGWGPYFFVVVTIAGMWPWICFVPTGVLELVRGQVVSREPAAERLAGDRASLAFLLWWFAIVLVFFSIPRAKLGSYILPGLPPLAILAGYALCNVSRAPAATRNVLGVIALANFGAAGVAFAAWRLHIAPFDPSLMADTLVALAALTVTSLAALLVAQRGRKPAAAIGALALGVLTALGLMIKARADAQPLGSYRALARAIEPYLASGCELASYRHFVQALPFYTGHREALVDYRGELAPFGRAREARASFIATDEDLVRLWRGPGCAVLIVNRADLPHVRTLLGSDIRVIGCEGKKLALYSGKSAIRSAARACDIAVSAR